MVRNRAYRYGRGYLAAGGIVSGLRALHNMGSEKARQAAYKASQAFLRQHSNTGAAKRATAKEEIRDRPTKRLRTSEAVINAQGQIVRSLPNLRASEMNGGDGDGSGKNPGLSETPIDEVMNVERGPPDYTFSSLPFYFDRYVGVNQWSDQWTFRMTSPYDCSVTTVITDQNAGAGVEDVNITSTDAADVTAQSARWFNFYAGMYKYYHVISARWHLTIENVSTEPLWVHTYYHNQDDLPANGSNADMFFWKGVKSHYVGAFAQGVLATGVKEENEMVINTDNDEDAATAGQTVNYETGNHVATRGASPILTLSDSYAPGDFKREIHLDSEVENWSLVTTNPALSERFSFRVRPQWDAQTLAAGDAINRERQIAYRFTWKCEYLVEFKELQDGLRYPIQNQPITVQINQTRGAP